MQTIGVRFTHGKLTVREAAELGCAACATPGGGCQFLGTAATSQVVAEALGLALCHSALAPSGQPVWLELARRSARALQDLSAAGVGAKDIVTDDALHNAMVVHAAFGGSTNLLLHVPAIALCGGPPATDRRGLGARQPHGAPHRQRAPERPGRPPDRARVPGRRRARGDAPPARSRAAAAGCPHGAPPPARRRARRVGAQRPAHARARAPGRARRHRPRRGHPHARAGDRARHDEHRLLPARQPRAGGLGRQEHGDRPRARRRRRRLPPHRAGPGVRERARGDRGDQGGHASPRATCSA